MGVFTNYLERLGSNFLVSAMIPSLALVVACILVFDPILNIAVAFIDPKGTPQLVSFSVIVFIFTVIIGFTLTALNTYILKLFEGYVPFFPFGALFARRRNAHLQKARSLLEERDRLKNWILQLENNAHIVGQKLNVEDLLVQYYKAVSDYDLAYPKDLSDVLPTRFGNTLKAAENYPGERYGFDGVHFWPRLVQVIPGEYKSNIDNVRNELSFLVNMSILSMLFCAFCMLAIVHSMWTSPGAGTDPSVFFEFMGKAGRYFLAAFGGFYLCRFFYNASIFSVGSFGLVIRSAFDLFRLDLLKKLGLEQPVNSIKEFETWQSLNELIVLGSHSLTFTKLDYRKEE
ncbi:MAG TPA: hypothetical protein VFY26_13005 [Anaerolineales bacterium]|nr:hypothetical protein [Anaerolineales bacterium]